MVYLYCISCLRNTILVGNPRYTGKVEMFKVLNMQLFIQLEREGIMEDAARGVRETSCGGDDDNIISCGGGCYDDGI